MKSWARERPPTRPARGSTDAATLTRIQVPVEGHSQGNPGQKRGEVGGETVPDGDYRSVQKEGNTPSGPSARPGPPRAGLLGVAPAPPRARRRYQRLFTRTMPASPPLDSPVSLLHRFFRNSSNICIMRSRFPRPPPLACAHTRTPAHAHSRAPPAPLRQRPRAARPGSRGSAARPLAHLVGGGAALGRQPAALGQRRGGALMLPVHGPGGGRAAPRAAPGGARAAAGAGGQRGRRLRRSGPGQGPRPRPASSRGLLRCRRGCLGARSRQTWRVPRPLPRPRPRPLQLRRRPPSRWSPARFRMSHA